MRDGFLVDDKAVGQRVIIGGVNYPDLCDHSAGVLVCESLMTRDLGDDILVEDLSFNPVAVVQRLQDEPSWSRIVFVSAIARGLRPPGSITAYRWDGELPDPEEVHRAVCDAVTGIIHIDNTLIVAKQFQALPALVCIVEIEPQDHEFGHALSASVEAAIEPACECVVRIARDESYARSLPLSPLCGAAAVLIPA